MGSSTKKKREKKQDFQKPKLKVGKTRPKNTNATDTSFSAKSIVLAQQSLSTSGRDATGLFNHNLSLLSSSNDEQRKNALQYLTTACVTAGEKGGLPQSSSAIVAKAQTLILDRSSGVRNQLLKLFKALPAQDLGPVDQLVIYIRAGMVNLSKDIRLSSLDLMDWLVDTNCEAIMASPGGWVKLLRVYENLISTKPGESNLTSNKLRVHQLNTLARFLTFGLTPPPTDPLVAAKRAARQFPVYQMDAHTLPEQRHPFGYLNLFGAVRNVESEVYDDAEERVGVFNELRMREAFLVHVTEAKKEAGEVGRAASAVEKALRLAEVG